MILLSALGDLCAGATTFGNVHQTTPLDSFVSTNSSGSTSAVLTNIPAAVGDVVYAAIAWDEVVTIAAGSDQTVLWEDENRSGVYVAGGARMRTAVSTNMGMRYTGSHTQDWAFGAVAIKPALSGESIASFVQTPSLCTDLSLPAGGVITMTNFIAVTSGTMPNPTAVTAQLQYGTNVFFTDTTADYSTAGGVTTLTWSAALPTATNIPAGAAITLVVSNGQSGVAFRIEYDSTNRPSRILLPTTSIIKVDTLGIYDGPYPGGTQVVNVAAGQPVYVRAKVSDPFGAYDITGLDLSIPAAGVNVSLNDAHMVASNNCSKTYEYPWQPLDAGNYLITVTAREGTEGVTNTAATTLSVTLLDLGTPSITEFTFGDDGVRTNRYATNHTVCVRVTDLDQDANTSVTETVTAVITTTSGDKETILLTETGPNAGIFTACLPASATVDGGDEDGTIYAPPGTVLYVLYTDPDDPTDQSEDTATVPLPADVPGLAVTKRLSVPADGLALVGEPVQFSISVVNVGDLTLTNVSLTDSFDTNHLTYASASPVPNTVSNGVITWTNIGPLTSGQTKTFSVSFAATAPSPATTNMAVAASLSVASTGTASVVITKPSHTVTKSLISPPAGPANYGIR